MTTEEINASPVGHGRPISTFFWMNRLGCIIYLYELFLKTKKSRYLLAKQSLPRKLYLYLRQRHVLCQTIFLFHIVTTTFFLNSTSLFKKRFRIKYVKFKTRKEKFKNSFFSSQVKFDEKEIPQCKIATLVCGKRVDSK